MIRLVLIPGLPVALVFIAMALMQPTMKEGKKSNSGKATRFLKHTQ